MIIAWLKNYFFYSRRYIYFFVRKNLNNTFYDFLTSINFFYFVNVREINCFDDIWINYHMAY